MKVLLEIEEDKADGLMSVLQHLPYVKAEVWLDTVTPYAGQDEDEPVLDNLAVAIEELKLVRAGQLEARDARALYHEL